MSNQRSVFLEKAWEIVEQESSVWDAIEVRNESFYYEINQKNIFKHF